MRVDSIATRISHFTEQLDAELKKGDSANFEKIFELAISRFVLLGRTQEKQNIFDMLDARKEQQKKVREYSNLFQGFGINSNTALTVTEAMGQAGGQILAAATHNKAFTAIGPAVGAFGGLSKEGKQAEKVLAQNAVDELKEINGRLAQSQQKSQGYVDGGLNFLKQLATLIHDTASKVLY